MAVYKSSFFAGDAVFVFSDLNTWGWITFGLGALAIASGLAIFSGREWARWIGIAIAGLGALGQLLTAQAYPLWSLMIMGVYLLAVYGLAVYGVRDSVASSAGSQVRVNDLRHPRVAHGYLRCERPGAPRCVSASRQ